jgi:hypothetical protein
MSQLQTVVNRLREQLKISGIPVDDTLVQEIADRGFLQIPMLFDSLIEGQPVDLVPDYLAAWLPSDQTNEAVPAGSTRPVPAVEISATTAELRRGAFSPVELTEKALARLAERDPELNAFQLVLVEEARVAARRAESELRQGVDRGPLHGIPMAIKDLLHYAGTPTTAGSTIRAGEVIGEDAAVVEKLRAAGAIIIGKTRMSEFAYAPGSINPRLQQRFRRRRGRWHCLRRAGQRHRRIDPDSGGPVWIGRTQTDLWPGQPARGHQPGLVARPSGAAHPHRG